jgi:hypothetical protein
VSFFCIKSWPESFSWAILWVIVGIIKNRWSDIHCMRTFGCRIDMYQWLNSSFIWVLIPLMYLDSLTIFLPKMHSIYLTKIFRKFFSVEIKINRVLLYSVYDYSPNFPLKIFSLS